MGIGVLFFLGLGVIFAISLLYLLIVALVPGIKVHAVPLTKNKDIKGMKPDLPHTGHKTDVSFAVKNTKIRGWLFLPKNIVEPVACIVMAHGFGGTRDMGLESYAIRFHKAGFAVLVFDYRHFGESEGSPRQLLWIPFQLEDWSAAVEYVRNLKGIDPKRIALWGTSLSGGHVIVKAARDRGIACVAAQCPGVDGHASAEHIFKNQGIVKSLHLILHGQRDMARSWLRLSPHTIPIAGKKGDIACLTTPGAYEGFGKLAPDNFINEVCARIVLRADKYRPVAEAQHVQCPVLLQICDHDEITPQSAAEQTVEQLGSYVDVRHYPIGHFDIYEGKNFEISLSDQLAFFRRHLDKL